MKKLILATVLIMLATSPSYVAANPDQNQDHPKYKWLLCDLNIAPIKWCNRIKK